MAGFDQRHLLDVGRILSDLEGELDAFVEEAEEYPEPLQSRIKAAVTKATSMLQSKSDILVNTILNSDLKSIDLANTAKSREEPSNNPSSPVDQRPSGVRNKKSLPKLTGQHKKGTKSSSSPHEYLPANIMMDLTLRSSEVEREEEQPQNDADKAAVMHEVNIELSGDKRLAESMKEIKRYKVMQEEFKVFRLVARNGRINRQSKEFVHFKERYQHLWTDIKVSFLDMEKLLQQYSVPTAHIKGEELASKVSALQTACTREALLDCIVNRDQVETLMQIPGRRFMTRTESAVKEAAIAIQSTIRRYLAILEASDRGRKKDAIPLLQGFWKVCKQRMIRRNKLLQRKAENEATWRELQAALKTSWKTMLDGQRTIVHVPSCSVVEFQRLRDPRLAETQNLQLLRVFDLVKPEVDVIYVAPFDVADAIKDYLVQMLEACGVTNVTSRFKIVVPENSERFPPHLSLSTLLLYSPRALRKIERYTQGRNAYIVPGTAGNEDKLLAIRLKLPLLGADPQTSGALTTQSGNRRIFLDAQVNANFSLLQVYERNEFLLGIAKLIALHVDVDNWLMKLDDETDGRGTGILLASNIPVVRELRREKKAKEDRTDYWNRVEVQENAKERLLLYLENNFPGDLVKLPVGSFSSCKSFFARAKQVGCVIEAAPHQVDGILGCTVFIPPEGDLHVVSAVEHLADLGTTCQGVACPLQSAPFAAVKEAAIRIGEVLKAEGILGYATVTFCAFLDVQSGEVKLAADELSFGPSLGHLANNAFAALANGNLNDETGQYLITTADASGKPSKRCFVALNHIFHPGLSGVEVTKLFRRCRQQQISFDLKEAGGVVFLLSDTLTAGVLGVIGIGPGTDDCLVMVERALKLLNELGTVESLTHSYLIAFTVILGKGGGYKHISSEVESDPFFFPQLLRRLKKGIRR